MPSRTPACRGLLALGLLLTLAGSCRFVPVDDDVVYACESDGSCASAEQVCSVQKLCVPRSQALRILQPADSAHVNGATRVEVALDVATVNPASIVLTITKQNQAPTTLSLKREQPGMYAAQWTPSQGAGAYTLHASVPDTGLESAPVTVVLDSEAPAFNVEVPPPTGSPSVGVLRLRDPDAPTAWRRDERVTVTVTSDDADIEASSVRLVVVGARANGDGRAEPPIAPQRVTACAHAYCGVVELDLAVPELSAFRGRFKLQARGTDTAGNAGSASAQVEVTRWRWELDLQGELATPVAISQQGNLFTAVRSGGGGRVLRISPEGVAQTVREGVLPYDSLAIGPTLVEGSEVLFLTEGPAQGTPFPGLLALKATTGQELGRCRASIDASEGNTRLVVGSGPGNDGSPRDVAFAGFYDAPGKTLEMVALRPDNPTAACLRFSVPPPVDAFSSVVTNGPHFFLSEDFVWTMSVEPTGIKDALLFTTGCEPGPARLAFIGSDLIGSEFNTGRGTRNMLQDRRCQHFQLQGSAGNRRISPLAIDAQSRLFYGKQGSDERTFYLARSPLTSGSGPVERTNPEEISTAPILGQGGWVYTTTRPSGRLQVWDRNLALVWEAPPLEGLQALALDCARDGAGQRQARPGVWYLGHGTRLRAITVDSHGLDTDAPWPISHHDPLNSGNSSVDLKQFACP